MRLLRRYGHSVRPDGTRQHRIPSGVLEAAGKLVIAAVEAWCATQPAAPGEAHTAPSRASELAMLNETVSELQDQVKDLQSSLSEALDMLTSIAKTQEAAAADWADLKPRLEAS